MSLEIRILELVKNIFFTCNKFQIKLLLNRFVELSFEI